MRQTTTERSRGILAVGTALLVGCVGSEAASGQRGPKAVHDAPGVAVRTAEVRPGRHRGTVVVSGDLRADPSALLGFTVGGRLERIDVQRGQTVQAGHVLGALDAMLARAALAQARAGVVAAQAQLRLAQDSAERTEVIRRHDGVTAAQVLQVAGQRDLAAAQLAVARAQAQQAEVNLRYHVLRAPFAGVVTQVPPGPGVIVGPGSPLFGLEGTATLVLDTSVTPAQAARLAVGSRVQVTVPATGARAEGVLRLVLPAADPAAHRVPIEIAVSNADGALVPHVLARAELETGEQPALDLPATCLVQREGALVVFVLGDGARARRVPVRLLAQQGERSLVEFDEALVRARLVDLPPPDLADGALLSVGGAP